MNKKIKRILYIIILIIVLLIFSVIIYKIQEENSLEEKFLISIQHKNNSYNVKYWYEEGTYYIFLPNFSKMENIKIKTNYDIYIDGKKLKEIKYKELVLNKEYEFIIKDANNDLIEESKIQFLKSSNIATMFIDTESQTMENIYANKEYKETAVMNLINENGILEYKGKLNYIKGRGNSSWIQDKKPFSIQLAKNTSLLEMGKAKNYVLISNFFDKTNLKNKIIYDFADEIGLDYSPSSNYIDLYLNGEYAGIYLLSEKLEIKENRIDISNNNKDNITGPYLLELDFPERYNKEPNGFITNRNNAIVIKAPNNITDNQKEYITNLWNEMEYIIFNKQDEIFKYIDLDSWVKKYLVEEIFANYDSNASSMFFYKKPDSESNLIYAGPVWDYDRALGNHMDFSDSKAYVININNTYWNALLQNETFKKEVIKQYNTLFSPKLKNILNKIDTTTKKIYDSSQMDIIRWKNHPITEDKFYIYSTYEEYVEYMKQFLVERIEFLNEEWNVE